MLFNRLLRASVVLVLGALAASIPLTAQERPRQPGIEIPVLELPYNLAHGARAPGMQQSLGLTSSLYETTHTLLGKVLPNHAWVRNTGIVFVDYLTLAAPFNDAWLHEEWHRSVLGQSRVNSRNDVWNLKNIFAEAISVSHVTDEDLIRFKKESPRDFVRMKAAGYEGENELISRLEKNQFFSQSKAWHVGLYWMVALNDQLYVGAVVAPEDSAEIDNLTRKANLYEKTIAERDVSGHDFTAWVYHLFRPEEPFDARGPHPSGVGLDRYIKVKDLTAEEKSFLKNEGKLAWLNFVDPNFLGIRAFSFRSPLNGERARGNFWMRHTLTSFGHSIDANFVYQQGNTGIHAVVQQYTNHDRSFPGLRVELVDKPVHIGSKQFVLSPRAGMWSQPRDQTFKTTEGQMGGLAGIRLATTGNSRLQFYMDSEIKSAGWVAGRTNLGGGATFLTGITYAFTRATR